MESEEIQKAPSINSMDTIVMVITIDALTITINGCLKLLLFTLSVSTYSTFAKMSRFFFDASYAWYFYEVCDKDMIKNLIEIFYFFLDNIQPVFTSFLRNH